MTDHPQGADLHLGGEAWAHPALDEQLEPETAVQVFPGNPRRGDQEAITASIRDLGLYAGVVAQRSTGYVVVGNHRLRALRELGARRVPVTWLDVDDTRAAAIVARDNLTSAKGTEDRDDLEALLRDLEDRGQLSLSGYTGNDLDEMFGAGDPTSNTDPDDVPARPAKPRTERGQTWLLGPHRLVVGDGTDPDVVAEALDQEPAALWITDPPYNVDYQGGSRAEAENTKRDAISNDAMSPAEFEAFMHRAYTAALVNTVEGGPAYLFHADGDPDVIFRRAMVQAGWKLAEVLIWVKHHFAISRQDYHWQHEPILYGWRPGAAHRWFGGFTPTTIILDESRKPSQLSKAELLAIVEQLYDRGTTALRADKPAASSEHPTAKPVELLVRLIENSSRRGDLVLDTFGGSGSTMIACHQTGRRCAMVELDPKYADVICRRYQEHTGVVPILAATGEPHDFARKAAA